MVCIHIQYFFGVVWSSNWRCSLKKGVLKNFAKSTGKHQCQILFFNKDAGLRSETLLKKRLCHRCFPMNFANFLRTPLVQNTSGRQLLWMTASKTWKTKEDQKFKKRMLCEYALNFDQWKTFSENYKPMRVWLWLVYKFTENCQIKKRSPTCLDKIRNLTRKLIVISS